ncbi:hypothetical protein SAMN00017405_0894 [Desulfonispora thiosulfatigenes DSM 11270]|uniref:Uncharacterized protein n=1 Tax=Desulfonispora thiosulfatigenes DSM 11270 TaxID=656914 RepID=A0A1W1UHG6_DESTI|nr:hypothetical protein [Desulfonispora thiosulfatigenes]SMB80517.1 hypothetical protein SAMN00017405_0894 [Desulfonispora thiosulfatigenes DSM 11270]
MERWQVKLEDFFRSKYIGKEMASRGYELEYNHCSSDFNSIDGVVIKDLEIGLADGTAPQNRVRYHN